MSFDWSGLNASFDGYKRGLETDMHSALTSTSTNVQLQINHGAKANCKEHCRLQNACKSVAMIPWLIYRWLKGAS